MKHTFRYDSVPWTPPEEARYTTAEDAARRVLDAEGQGEAAAARRRMLEREQGRRKSESAAAARRRMLQREKR